MTAIARFEVIPVRDGSMSTAVARAVSALEQFPVSYETTATDTIIEGDTVADVFAAVRAAHEAIPDDRVITAVEVDEVRGRQQGIGERVASVERHLGHPPRRIRESRQAPQPQRTQQFQQPQQRGGQQRQVQPAGAQPPARDPPRAPPAGQSQGRQSYGTQQSRQPR